MFYDKGDSPYLPKPIHPEDRKALDELTAPKSWGADRFRETVSAIGALGPGVSVPAYNRPNSIDLSGWKTWRETSQDLLGRSRDGNEYGIAVFVDLMKGVPFFSDKITRGKGTGGFFNFEKPKSRPNSTLIGTMHVHPEFSDTQHGLSDTDYFGFLLTRQQFMSIVYGASTIMALKTSVTPNNLNPTAVKSELDSYVHEFFGIGSADPRLDIVNFNKAVCTHFGLTLFTANFNNPDLLKRAEVTQ